MSTLLLNNILPYVYKLTHKETGQFYIGYRCANKVRSELDILRYKSSSKYVKELGFENFNIEIIAEFFNAEDAYEFEQNLIKESFDNNLILNKSYFIKGKFNGIGRNLSQEAKDHLSKINSGENHYFYGKKHSIETRKKISLNHARLSGENSPMFGKKDNLCPTSIPVLINGVKFNSISEAARQLKYDPSCLTKIIRRKRNLNNKIWQAEYI